MTKFLSLLTAGALFLAPAWAAAGDDAAVIGKLKLLKNGEQIVLGPGLLANPAKLTLIDTATQERQRLKVGKDGAFSSRLAAGQYRLTDIEFLVRGERVNAQGNFLLTVADSQAATYVGTVTLQTTFESGHYGLSGSVDGYSIANDCAADCARMLSRLGLADESVTVALMRPNQELVSREF